ncbi:unnamed protein product, partial [Prorocentrum cordatum]
ETTLRVVSSAIPRRLYSMIEIDQELEALASQPLGVLAESLEFTGPEVQRAKEPWQVPFYPPDLKGVLDEDGNDYLDRLGKDVDELKKTREERRTTKQPICQKKNLLSHDLHGLLDREPQQSVVEGGKAAGHSLKAMASLKEALLQKLDAEREQMDAAWVTLKTEFGLQYSTVPPRALLSALFSDRCTQDLKRLTKSDKKAASLAACMGLLMARTCRIAQLEMCVTLTQGLHVSFSDWLVRALLLAHAQNTCNSAVTEVLHTSKEGKQLIALVDSRLEGEEKTDPNGEKGELAAVLNDLLRAASNIFNMMQVKRWHGPENSDGTGCFECDIRCLLVEFCTGFLLRQRQYCISRDLAECAKKTQSVVQQMIMGAGKSTVIGPLLALMLANGETLVMVICPEALLAMSRDCLTAILGSVLGRRVYQFYWLRQILSDGNIAEVESKVIGIRRKMERAAHDQGCFITTPGYVKTFFLQYVHAMVDAAKVDQALTLPAAELKKQRWGNIGQVLDWYRTRERIADEMARVLQFWRDRCTVVIDEVDLVLHPLKSELNFPIGSMEPLQPTPERYTMPVFLLEAPICAASEKTPAEALKHGPEAKEAFDEVKEAIGRGIAEFSVQRKPLVIMSKDWYHQELKGPMGKWALVFLQQCLRSEWQTLVGNSEKADIEKLLSGEAAAAGPLPRMTLASAATRGTQRLSLSAGLLPLEPLKEDQEDSAESINEREKERQMRAQSLWAKWWGAHRGVVLHYIGAAGSAKDQSDACELVKRWGLSEHKVQVLNKCREWIRALLVHCLSKRSRIDYGLLIPIGAPTAQVLRTPQASRQLMAVPFVGKDVPSKAAEFASPDVAIGLTYLAYEYEGLRRFMFYILVYILKDSMNKETGPFDMRPSWTLFDEWVVQAKVKRPAAEVLPLDLFAPGDEDQLDQLQELMQDEPAVRSHFLLRHVFQKLCYIGENGAVKQIAGTEAMMTRLSSSSMDLGGEMIFNVRIGFTGTPNEVLPQAFAIDGKRCKYELMSDAEIVCTLTSKECVEVQVVGPGHPAREMGEGKHVVWSVDSLLGYIATQALAQKWTALIDTGALITGQDNLGVAKILMERGLRESGFKGVVYLDTENEKRLFMADGREGVPFATCGLKPGERFTFFDQVHCTGMDIPQVPNAIGVATLGKGMTLRDHAQAAWRMRKFGEGQKIVLLVIPEVMKQVDNLKRRQEPNAPAEDERGTDDGGSVPKVLDQQTLLNDIMAWEALSLQQLRDCWRRGAMADMLRSRQPPKYQAGDKVKVQG